MQTADCVKNALTESKDIFLLIRDKMPSTYRVSCSLALLSCFVNLIVEYSLLFSSEILSDKAASSQVIYLLLALFACSISGPQNAAMRANAKTANDPRSKSYVM